MAGDLDKLLRDIRKPFSRRQERAVEALVRMGDEAVEPMAALLFAESADYPTQNAAFRVLERIGTPAVIPHMLRMAREAASEYYAAARFLARRRDPALLASLLEIARGTDRFAAAAVLGALGECGERRLLPDILGLVETRQDEARKDAIEAAAELGGPDAFGAILPLLKDPDGSIRVTAARALTKMKHPDAARHIAEALKTDEDDFSIKRMAEYLIELNATGSLPVILEALRRIQGKSALHESIAGLGGGNPADIAPYLHDPDADVRIAAVIALGGSGSARAVAPLLTVRADPEYRVRQEVRKALKRLKGSGVSFSMPRAGIGDLGVAVLEVLAAYFQIPSSEGFSAYRTGWIAHFGFSAIVAATIFAVASGAVGLELLPSAVAALAGVILLWGVGVLVGVLSHYNPLILIAVVIVIIVLFVKGSQSIALGIPIAVAGHALMHLFAFTLRLLTKALA
jgi:HEAT repeat protein